VQGTPSEVRSLFGGGTVHAAGKRIKALSQCDLCTGKVDRHILEPRLLHSGQCREIEPMEKSAAAVAGGLSGLLTVRHSLGTDS
jgi:hypothetical protein